MSERVWLSGDDWQLKDFYGEDWRWRDSHKADTRDTRYWRRGSVPGSVHHDLWQAGEIPDPYFERNSLLIEWIPQRTWIYKKSFFLSETLRGKHLRLHLEGVDYEAEFFLNGLSLGKHNGMYTPAAFDIHEQVQFGADNLLAVVIEAAPHEQPQVSRTNRVRTHKSRMTYWWDFCPRMIHIGIWDEVYIEVNDGARVADVWARTTLDSDHAHAAVQVAVTVNAATAQPCVLETTIRFGEQVVAAQRDSCGLEQGATTLTQRLGIDQPRLWWPNGSGDQALYEAEVRLIASDGRLLHDKNITFGIRDIQMVANEESDPAALPYTLLVNGKKTYIKGWNWVPMDVLYGVPQPDKLDHLLRLAQQAHVNLLRIWGGGLIERESFYDRCDQLGIMVWQEFIQSSSGIENTPPVDAAYMAMMVGEAEQIIPRKRNHPSLVIWCGGNELTDDAIRPLDNRHPLLGALGEVVARLDPDRVWLPTSPSGRVFMNALETIADDPAGLHDVHGPWEYQGVTAQYTLYNRSTSLLHSEFGVEGVTNLKSLNATIAPDHQWPVTLDNPLWQHLGAWWVKAPMWEQVFGAMPDIVTVVRATQLMQAEGLRYALESSRRRQFHNSGTLPWQFNEPYPVAACTSAVDYYGQAKPVYYAVARAYAPLHVSAKFPTMGWAEHDRFEAEIWIHTAQPVTEGRLTMRLVGSGGQVYHEQHNPFAAPASAAVRLVALAWPLARLDDEVFFLDLQAADAAGTVIAHNRYPFTRAVNLAPLLALPPTQLHVQHERGGDEGRLTLHNSGSQTAFGVWLEDGRPARAGGFLYLDDNHFSVFPDETRVIAYHWQGVPGPDRILRVGGWNTAEWMG